MSIRKKNRTSRIVGTVTTAAAAALAARRLLKLWQSAQGESSSSRVERQCSATTGSGEQCRRMTDNPSGLCWQHTVDQ